MKARLLSAGYFGCGNLGDDAILLALRDNWGGEVGALSGNPEDTHRNFGIRAWPRKDLNQVRMALEEHDALVFPGGSIFQDITSQRSIFYYLSLIKLAKKMNKKVILVGQGVGPINKFFGKRWAQQAFGLCDAIAVRDPSSAKLISSLGVQKSVTVTADMAFLIQNPPRTGSETSFGVGDMKTIGLAPRRFLTGGDSVALFSDLSQKLFQMGFVPTLLEMDAVNDRSVLNEIDKRNGGKVPSIRNVSHPVDLLRRLQRMEAVIAVRLHAGILSSVAGVPSVMVNYDPKVAAFATEAGLPSVPVNNITVDRVLDALNGVLKSRDAAIQNIETKRDALRKSAEKNIEVIANCVSR